MENITHIHEVLNLIYSSENKYTTQSLVSEIESRFGSSAKFNSCADHVFGINGIIPFLLERQKIRLEGEDIIPVSPACSH